VGRGEVGKKKRRKRRIYISGGKGKGNGREQDIQGEFTKRCGGEEEEDNYSTALLCPSTSCNISRSSSQEFNLRKFKRCVSSLCYI
jgi:hypothetical protein